MPDYPCSHATTITVHALAVPFTRGENLTPGPAPIAPTRPPVYVPDMRRNGVFRGWAILWAVLQFALPLGATFADARLERESARAPGAHIEETSNASCRPSHSDDCALCQFLSRAAAPSQGTTLPEITVSVRSAYDAKRAECATHGVARVSLPRAPPASPA